MRTGCSVSPFHRQPALFLGLGSKAHRNEDQVLRPIEGACFRVKLTWPSAFAMPRVDLMQGGHQLVVARISAETSASAHLTACSAGSSRPSTSCCAWWPRNYPRSGRRVGSGWAAPSPAPRALLCALWLLEDEDGGGCLMQGSSASWPTNFVRRPDELQRRDHDRDETGPRSGINQARQSTLRASCCRRSQDRSNAQLIGRLRGGVLGSSAPGL